MGQPFREVKGDGGRIRPTLSLIIVTYNRFYDINLTLSLLKDQDADFELIVVDNGSTSEGEIRLEGWKNSTLIRLDSNRGATGGRNYGAGIASGDILVFLDDDAGFARRDTLSRIRDRFMKNERLGILTADSRLFPSGDVETAAIPRRDKRVLAGDYETSYFCAVSFAVRRRVLDETGGFFEPLFFYGEELDLSWKTLDAGYEIVRAADFIVLHRLSSEERSPGRWIYFNTRNRAWLSLLHLPWKYVVSYCLFWWTHLFLKSLRARAVFSFVDGVRDGLLGVPAVLERRKVLEEETIGTIRRLNGRLPF